MLCREGCSVLPADTWYLHPSCFNHTQQWAGVTGVQFYYQTTQERQDQVGIPRAQGRTGMNRFLLLVDGCRGIVRPPAHQVEKGPRVEDSPTVLWTSPRDSLPGPISKRPTCHQGPGLFLLLPPLSHPAAPSWHPTTNGSKVCFPFTLGKSSKGEQASRAQELFGSTRQEQEGLSRPGPQAFKA